MSMTDGNQLMTFVDLRSGLEAREAAESVDGLFQGRIQSPTTHRSQLSNRRTYKKILDRPEMSSTTAATRLRETPLAHIRKARERRGRGESRQKPNSALSSRRCLAKPGGPSPGTSESRKKRLWDNDQVPASWTQFLKASHLVRT